MTVAALRPSKYYAFKSSVVSVIMDFLVALKSLVVCHIKAFHRNCTIVLSLSLKYNFEMNVYKVGKG